jgi:hypothetical protein
MSSRLAVDQRGRTVVVITTPSVLLRVGMSFPVIDALELNTWLKAHGRAPTAKERGEARPPYESTRKRREALEAPEDDLLDEQAALEACMREQQREPVDLIGRAAIASRTRVY